MCLLNVQFLKLHIKKKSNIPGRFCCDFALAWSFIAIVFASVIWGRSYGIKSTLIHPPHSDVDRVVNQLIHL